MRAFVGVRLPPPVVAHLDERLDALRGTAPGLRWVPSELWHLTLTFLGEVDDERVPDLEARLARAAGRTRAFQLQVQGAGRFGRQVLWAGIHGDLPLLRRLAERTAAAARRAGIGLDDRRFRPHLTLARASRPVDLRPLTEALTDYAGPSWEVSGFELVHSVLRDKPDGATRYDTVRLFPLVDGPSRPPD